MLCAFVLEQRCDVVMIITCLIQLYADMKKRNGITNPLGIQ